jgi:uncharacterized membrane protein YhaH (DUF805 family)
MLSFIFGLNARLGRLQYFLATIALAVAMTVMCFLLVYSLFNTVPHDMQMSRAIIFETMKWPVIGLGVLFALITFTLQSMRIRDIGWDPVCVIPTWIALMVIDFAVAHKFPGLSVGPERYGTVVGGLLNLGMTLALLFWPSGDPDGSTPSLRESRGWPDPSPPSRRADTVATDRIARASGGEFGRRTF